MRVIELDVRDDQLLIPRRQTRERRAIAVFGLGRQRARERIRCRGGERLRRSRWRTPSRDSTMFVAHAIENSRPEISGKRMPSLRFERVEPAQRSKDRVLYEIGCLDRRARPSWKPAVSPAAEWGETAKEQPLEIRSIVVPHRS